MARLNDTRILVVDDDPASGAALSALLEDLGPRIMTVTSGEEALRKVLEHEFALIILDVKMPGLDGFETAALIRGRRRSYQTPIVFLTGKSAEDTYVFKGYEVGAVDYMVKPVVPEVLRSKVMVFVDLYEKTYEIKQQREALRRSAQASAKRFYDLVQGLDAIVWEYDVLEQQFSFVSQQAESILGHRVEQWRDDKNFLSNLIHPDDRRRAMEVYSKVLERLESQESIYRARHAEGHFVWIRDTIRVVRDGQARPIQLRGVMVDVTAHKEAEERLAQMAHFDALTGLPNRHLLEDRLREIMSRRNESEGMISAVLFLDLDRFKFVNDTMGHDVGDALLKSIGKRLRGCIRDHDVAARLGGDEFIAIIDRISSSAEAAMVAEKILHKMSQPVMIGAEEVYVTCSIGISCFPEDGTTAEELLKNADMAMYVAKERGKNIYQFYRAEMNAHLNERQELEQALHRAVERDEFVLHYQPKFNLKTGEICGCEALIRWDRPGHGLIPPAQFVPILEESGLIVQVGDWAIRTACEQSAQWRRSGERPLRISVNVSPIQLNQDDLLSRVRNILAETEMDATELELEVTESSVMTDVDRAAKVLRSFGDMGISITIDDFGTGHSSLSALRSLPIHGLKIDKCFVRDLPGDDGAQIAIAILSMAKSLGIHVIAEGVENPGQLKMLREQGCDEGQGNFLGPASAVEDFDRDVRHPSFTGNSSSVGAV